MYKYIKFKNIGTHSNHIGPGLFSHHNEILSYAVLRVNDNIFLLSVELFRMTFVVRANKKVRELTVKGKLYINSIYNSIY